MGTLSGIRIFSSRGFNYEWHAHSIVVCVHDNLPFFEHNEHSILPSKKKKAWKGTVAKDEEKP
jgi:hypothetical protein